MYKSMNAMLIAACSVVAASSISATAQTARSVDFSKTTAAVTISSDGVQVTLQPFFDDEGNVEVATAVHAPGFQAIIAKEDISTRASFKRAVGVERLSPQDAVPSVLLGTFTGGAHCCATLRVITPSAGKLVVVDFEPVDGEPDLTLPKDIDGDGTVDFVRQDDRFRYQFASGAGSYSPPIFLNIYKGQIVDVSDQPTFRPLWLKFANEVRKVCADKTDIDRNGACAALVAAGARLGSYPQFLREATKNAYSGADIQLPASCQVALIEYRCPSGKEVKFFTFEDATSWFLRRNGYLK